MKKRFLSFLLSFIFVLGGISLSGCFGSVVPCAWVKLDMVGYIYYTSYVYGDHIYLYENEENFSNDKYHADYELCVHFFPRILGADTVDDVRTTTVDISKNYSMIIYIIKDKPLYSTEKNIYLNGEKLIPVQIDDLDTLLCLTFENFTLVRGNPNGSFNNYVNTIEYK